MHLTEHIALDMEWSHSGLPISKLTIQRNIWQPFLPAFAMIKINLHSISQSAVVWESKFCHQMLMNQMLNTHRVEKIFALALLLFEMWEKVLSHRLNLLAQAKAHFHHSVISWPKSMQMYAIRRPSNLSLRLELLIRSTILEKA